MSPVLATQPQTLALAQALQAPEPREKPASQHDSHIPSGWNAFIWPSPVGRDLINSLHAFTKLHGRTILPLSTENADAKGMFIFGDSPVSSLGDSAVPGNQGGDLSEHLRGRTESFLGEWEEFV